jgi:serine/threonine protein phosphatase PrpC
MSVAPAAIDACAVQHIGDRREQQDRLGLFRHPKLPRIVLAALADGMGGHTGGALAAEQVVLTAKNSLDQYSPREDFPRETLAAALREAHLLIRSGRWVNEQDPHSTGVLLLVEGPQVTWAHCGDSRLYRFRDGRCLFRTADHSWVAEQLRGGLLSAAQAASHPRRSVLVTSLGGAEAPRIDTGGADDVAAGDAFLLCSDGLWEYFRNEELAAVIASQGARDAAEQLLALARERAAGEGDNVSLVILKFLAADRDAPH